MTIQEIIRCCLDILVGGFCLVVCGVLCVGGARFVERRLLAAVVEAGRRCGMQVASALLAVSLVCTVVAQKGGDTNSPPDGVSGTNTVEQTGTNGTNDTGGVAGPLNAGGLVGVLHSPLPILNLAEPFAVRPANAVENAWWRARGAHVDGMTIPAEGWSFRTPTGFLDSLLVYSYGEIQPNVETAYFPRPFPEADLSLLPEGRWGMMPHEGAESLFWHATSPSNSLILTWQNAAYGQMKNVKWRT